MMIWLRKCIGRLRRGQSEAGEVYGALNKCPQPRETCSRCNSKPDWCSIDHVLQKVEWPNAPSSVAFGVTPEHARRTDRRTSPRRETVDGRRMSTAAEVRRPHGCP